MPRETFLDYCCQCPCPWGEPLLTHASTGDPSALAGSFDSVFCGITAPFFCILACLRVCLCPPRASLVAQTVKSLPAMQETWVQSLGWEDPLEKEMATHSSILAWKIPWMEEPGGLQFTGSQRVRHNWETNTFFLSKTEHSVSPRPVEVL